jgi:hypothetical protein
MFYYVQDGDAHWEVLGPKDVIPGNNIFGGATAEDINNMSREELQKKLKDAIPQDFKILVSPDRYEEFLSDPNWLAYRKYIEPVDFNPTNSDMNDFTFGGLTYGYVTSPGGIMQTSQTVSQDISWWTAPRIAIEVIMDALTAGQIYSAWHTVKKALTQTAELAAEAEAIAAVNEATTGFVVEEAANRFMTVGEAMNMMLKTSAPGYAPQIFKTHAENEILKRLITVGLVSEKGVWATPEKMMEVFMKYGVNQVEDEFVKAGITYYTSLCSSLIRGKIIPQVMDKAINGLPMIAVKLGLKGAGFAVSPTSLLPKSTMSTAYYSTNCWGGTGSYNGDALQKGMRENILSNIHQVGLVGGGYVITTPQKNLCYHTYIKDVPASTTDAVIYAGTGKGQGRNNNARTITMAKKAFHDHTNL